MAGLDVSFTLLDAKRLPEQVGHLILDVDKTITSNDRVDGSLLEELLALADAGIYQSYVTGRDARWLEEHLVEPMRESPAWRRPKTRSRLSFLCEVGCVRLELDSSGASTISIHPLLRGHPLTTPEVRSALRQLSWDPDRLEPYSGRALTDRERAVHDANGLGFVIDASATEPPLARYTWSTYKTAFATFEKLRDSEGRDEEFDQRPHARRVLDEIARLGHESDIVVEIIGTALNVTPVVDGQSLGKAWASGQAIVSACERVDGHAANVRQVTAATLAIGDGLADLDFGIPAFPSHPDLADLRIPIGFVGGKVDLLGADRTLLENIAYQALDDGAPDSKGAPVTRAILSDLRERDLLRRLEDCVQS